jgi:phage recombination protein Bet
LTDAPKKKTAAATPPAALPTRMQLPALVVERFDMDDVRWKALVETVFPAAKSIDSIVMALAYCAARNLDPFKRVVHIVPMWDANQKKMIDTVWPGIAELRTTAFRTKQYAGQAPAEFGPDVTEEFTVAATDKRKAETFTVTYPEWAQISVWRVIGDQRVEFAGPRVYWKETYATASRHTNAPNAMWRQRPRGQIIKCSEAAALRAAFPEEIGNDLTDDEMYGKTITPAGEDDRAAPTRPNFANYKGATTAERAAANTPEGGLDADADPAIDLGGAAAGEPDDGAQDGGPEADTAVELWPLVDHVGEEIGSFAGDEWLEAYREAVARAAGQGGTAIETFFANNADAIEAFANKTALDEIDADAMGVAFAVDQKAEAARAAKAAAKPGRASQDARNDPGTGEDPDEGDDAPGDAPEDETAFLVEVPTAGNASDRWTAWYTAMGQRVRACATLAELDRVAAVNTATMEQAPPTWRAGTRKAIDKQRAALQAKGQMSN